MRFFLHLCFYLFFGISTIIFSIFGSFLIFLSKYINNIETEKYIQYWAKLGLFLIKLFLKIEIKFEGEIPKNSIIACQHHSPLEIIALAFILKKPTFVFKHTLLKIPFFGYCLKNLRMISVNRKKINPHWMPLAQENLKNGYNLIIFPEGGTINFGEIVEYKKGVFKLAIAEKRKIIPVYINFGLFWPKKKFFKNPGVATMKFGNPIEPNPTTLREALKEMA